MPDQLDNPQHRRAFLHGTVAWGVSVAALHAAAPARVDRRTPTLGVTPLEPPTLTSVVLPALPYAEATGLRWVHFTSGIPSPDMPFERCYATYLANLRFALDLFARHRVGVLVEPINTTDLPGYFIGNLHWRVRFEPGAILVALEGPESHYTARLVHLTMPGKIRIAGNG